MEELAVAVAGESLLVTIPVHLCAARIVQAVNIGMNQAGVRIGLEAVPLLLQLLGKPLVVRIQEGNQIPLGFIDATVASLGRSSIRLIDVAYTATLRDQPLPGVVS